MIVKRIAFLLLLTLIQVEGVAQKTPIAQWPVKKAVPGEHILSKPGEMMGREKNYGDLVIGGHEGDTIVAPLDGVIESVGYNFSFQIDPRRLSKMPPIKKGECNCYDSCVRSAFGNIIHASLPALRMDAAKYVSYTVGIKAGAADIYYVSGLRPVRFFKTGEKIGKGMPIGKMGYCDTVFATPHIKISRSVSNKVADPMEVFGIPSTFVKFSSAVDYGAYKHSVADLQEAFRAMRGALEEAHPGFYDYTLKVTMDSLLCAVERKIVKPMTSEEFRRLVTPIVTSIRDVHTSLYSGSYSCEVRFAPQVNLAWVNGELRITRSDKVHRLIAGVKVMAVNGLPVNEVVRVLRAQFSRKEGYNELPLERRLLSDFLSMYAQVYTPTASSALKITLEDGRVIVFPYLPMDDCKVDSDTVTISMRLISPTAAYLDVNTFQLNEVAEDSIQKFIQRVEKSRIPNLIVDVRDNRGGEIDVLERLTSYFIKNPYRSYCYKMVKSNATYPSLKDSQNYSSSEVLFPEFQPVAGKPDFYLENTSQVAPDSATHFSGKLYVLANELSVSAASDFAAVMVDQGVGTLVGRETGSCYYQMNAEKFADYRLGKTGLILRVPLVKIVSREALNPRIPYGHGVIPDVEVPLTLEEFTQPKDVVLERALELIGTSNGLSMQ